MLGLLNLRKPRDAGQAAVEFALAILIFLPILFFIMDFGWVTFQKASFEYAYMHASWEAALPLNDPQPIDSLIDYDADPVQVKAALLQQMKNSAAIIIGDNLDIPTDTAKAHFHTDQKKFEAPSSNPDKNETPISSTRTVHLQADIKYTIHPLTPFGSLFFSSDPITKHLDCTRVVRMQHRAI